MASQVVAIVNQRRAEAGCGALTDDAGLAGAAFAHSLDMGTRNYASHDTPEGLTAGDRAIAAGVASGSGENIAGGQTTAEDAMGSWMNSENHKNNILNCNYTRLGVGVAQGSGDYRVYWTQMFA